MTVLLMHDTRSLGPDNQSQKGKNCLKSIDLANDLSVTNSSASRQRSNFGVRSLAT